MGKLHVCFHRLHGTLLNNTREKESENEDKFGEGFDYYARETMDLCFFFLLAIFTSKTQGEVTYI